MNTSWLPTEPSSRTTGRAVHPAHRDEDRAGAVVVQVVIRGVEPDAAQVGDEGRRVHRVVARERWREQVPAVEDALGTDGEAEQRSGQVQKAAHLAIGGGVASGLAVAERVQQAIDHRGKRLAGSELQLGREHRCVALQALLGAQRQPDATPVVQPAAGDETVEARELRQRDADRVEDAVECGDAALGGTARVEPRQRLQHRAGRNVLLEQNEGAVPGRHDERHDPPQRMEIRDRRPVSAHRSTAPRCAGRPRRWSPAG